MVSPLISPWLPIAGLGVIALLLAIHCFGAPPTSRPFDLMIGCFVCILMVFGLFHRELLDARLRTYTAFYRDIGEGMTRTDIANLLARRYPGDGARQRPTIFDDTAERLGFFMNPETSTEPNCEAILLTLKDGRIIKKEYSPD